MSRAEKGRKEAGKESLIPAGIGLSRITMSGKSNTRRSERNKENERRDQSAQVRLAKLED